MGCNPDHIATAEVEPALHTAALIKKLGGRIYKEATDIPTIGRFAVIADPQGAAIMNFKPTRAMELHDQSKQG
jgi:predicted enzyme related to lactoylglutathione lyase